MPLYRLITVWIYTLFLFSFIPEAQAKPLTPYKFKRYLVEDGLSQGTILSMYQDDTGFLWLGTEDGLNRFDGYEFVNFSENSALHGRYIQAIIKNKQGDLWVGTSDALNLLPKGQESFESFTQLNSPAFKNNNVQSLLVDSKNTLWIGTESGLYKKHQDNLIEQVQVTQSIINFSSLYVISITEISNDILWLGTSTGIVELNTSNHSSREIKLFDDQVKTEIRAIFKNSRNDVWVATHGNGIFKTSLNSDLFEHFKSPDLIENKIFDIAEDSRGRMWFGMDSKGVQIFEYGSGFHLLTHDPVDNQSLSGNAIETIVTSPNGDVWVGTTRNGLNQHKVITENFIHMKNRTNDPLKLLGNDVRAMGLDDSKRLWIGVYGEGWSILDTNKSTITNLTSKDGLVGNHQQTMTSNNSEFVWSYSELGLNKINAKTLEVVNTFTNKNSDLIGGRIITAIDDNKGNLWIGHWGLGITKFNKTSKTFTNYQTSNSSLPSNVISKLLLMPNGDIWISSRSGLTLLTSNDKEFKTYPFYENNQAHYYHDVIRHEDTLWISSSNGIKRFNLKRKSYEKSLPNEVLKNEMVYKLLFDDNQYVWASTNQGLFRLNQDLTHSVRFQTDDGVQGNEFNGGVGVKLPNGKLAFGGVNGASIFQPYEISASKNDVSLVKFQLQTKSDIKEVTLNKDNNYFDLPDDTLSLTISLSSLTFDATNKIKYRYRKSNEEWVLINKNEVMIPVNEAGKFTYEFSSTNSFGDWLPTSTKIDIFTPKKWYWQPAMIIFYLVSFLTILFLMYKLRIKNIQEKSNELEAIVEKRTFELINSNKHISIQAKELKLAAKQKKQLFETISHELRTPITLILGPVQQLRKKMTDTELIGTTTLIERNATRLNRLVNQLLDLSRTESTVSEVTGQVNISDLAKSLASSFKSYASDANINLTLTSCDNILVDINLDDAEKLISNLLSNAIKYTTPNDSVGFEVSKEGEFAVLTVKDTGIGIKPDHISNIFTRFYRVDSEQTETIEGSGIGLSIVKSIIDKANGNITVDSELGRGTTFTIRLPISNSPSSIMKIKSTIQTADVNSELASNIPSLLLVDDNKDILTYVSSVLTNDYNITTATNGKEGIEAARTIIPDIIISDVMMPGIDGLELLETLKKDELTNHIPIILLTAKGSDESKIKGLKLHADDYISKPFNEDELSLRLRNILDTRDILKKKFSAEIMIEPQSAIKQEKPAFIIKLESIIEKHYQDSSFSVAELAKEAAVGERQLLRKLKATADVGAKEYIRSYRLKKAAELLHQGNTATLVAAEVGFSSAAYFSNCFKAFYGVTPSQYVNSTAR